MNNASKKSRFDLSQMGEADKHNLASTFCEAVQRFYDDPVNRKKFEEWQRQRQAEQSSTGKPE